MSRVFTLCLSTQEEVMNSMFLFWSPFVSVVIETNTTERRLIHFIDSTWTQYFPFAKRSLGQGNVFTPVCQSFCSQGEGCLPHCMLGHTLQADTPGQTSSLGRHPAPRLTPPHGQTPPPPGGYYGIRSTSGRYACYFNAYLFWIFYTLFSIIHFLWSSHCGRSGLQEPHLEVLG